MGPGHVSALLATDCSIRVDSLQMMSSRVKRMRQELYQRLRTKGTPGSWEHIVTQIGMFCFTGLSRKSVLQWDTYCDRCYS